MKYEPTAQECAAVYARKSTKAENNSIESQTSLALDVIQKKGLLLYKIYSDRESVTKYEPIHRMGFKELMHDAMEGKFKTLVVFRRDRLARKAAHLIEIKKFFKKYDIKIIYSNEGEFQPDDTYISNFIENIIMAVDELEPRILAERIEIGKNKKRERGEYVSGGQPPFGYQRKLIEGSTRYVCVPEEIELIKKLFNEFINGSSTSLKMKELIKEIKIIKSLKNKKLYEETGDKRLLKPKAVSVINTIKAPVYANLQFKSNKLRIKNIDVFSIIDDGNPIINRELFQECCNVDKAIDANVWYQAIEKWKFSNVKRSIRGKKIETQLFKDLLFCNNCKKKIWFTKNNLRCKKGCVTISKDVAINKILFAVLGKIVENEYFTNMMESKINELNAKIIKSEETLTTNAKLIKNCIIKMVFNKESADDVLANFFNKEHDINEKLSVLKMKKMDLLYLRDNIKSIIISPKVITDLKEKQDYLQNMLQNFIEKVYIDANEQSTITFRK